MNTRSQKIFALLLAVAICGAVATLASGQQSAATRVLPPRIIHYSGDMALLLVAMSETYATTIGLETDPLQPRSLAQIDLRNPSLADVMDAIVQSVPRYQWRENEGAVEVFPVRGGSSLLDTNIAKFQVTDVDATDAIDQLLMLPEVQANLRSMNLERKEVSTERSGKKFSLRLENVSMRKALSAIAEGSGIRFWIFRREGNRFFTISTSPR